MTRFGSADLDDAPLPGHSVREVQLLHQQYRSADPVDFPYPLWAAFQAQWKQLHPDWSHRMWTDAEEAALIEAEVPELMRVYTGLANCSDLMHIMRADIASYAVLYVHGGMYADMDSVPLAALEDLVRTAQVRGAEVVPTFATHYERARLKRRAICCN